MDFKELLSVADYNRAEAKSQAEVKRYSTTLAPPKKTPKSNVQSGAVKQFLAKKQAEEQHKAEEAKKKRDELLALRSQNSKNSKKAKIMASRTKDNDFSKIKLTDDEIESKKKREIQLLRMTLNNKVERMKARIEMEEQEKLLPRKRKRKSKLVSSEGKEMSPDEIVSEHKDFNGSKRHKFEPYIPEEASSFHSEKHKNNVKKKTGPPPGPALSFHDLLRVAATKQYEPIPLPVVEEDDDDDQRPLTKKARRMLVEEENRIRRKMAMAAKEASGKDIYNSKTKEISNDTHSSRPSETSNNEHSSKPRETSNNQHSSRPRETGNSQHSSRPRETSNNQHSSRPRETSNNQHSSRSRETSNNQHSSRPRETSNDHHSSRPRETSKDHHSSRPREASNNQHSSRPRETSNNQHSSRPRETNNNQHSSRPRETSNNHDSSRVNGIASKHTSNSSSDIREKNYAHINRKNLTDHNSSGPNRPVVVRVQDSKADHKSQSRPVPQAKSSSASNGPARHSSEISRPNPFSDKNGDKKRLTDQVPNSRGPNVSRQQSSGKSSEIRSTEQQKDHASYNKDRPPSKKVVNGNLNEKNQSVSSFKTKADLEIRRKNFLSKGNNKEKSKIAPSSMQHSNSNGKLSLDKETLAEIERRIRSEVQKELEAKLSKSNTAGPVKKTTNSDNSELATRKQPNVEKKVSSHPPFRTSSPATQNPNGIKPQSVHSKQPSGNISASSKVSSNKPTVSLQSGVKGIKEERPRTLMGKVENQKLPSKNAPIQNRPQISAKSEMRKEMLPPRKQPSAKPPIAREQKPRFHPNPYLDPPRRLLESRRPLKMPPRKRIESDDDDDEDEMNDFIDDGPFQDDQEEDYSKYIKEIFGYDRSRYLDDDDDENMETSFAEQMKEEVRSAKIGYLEDLEDIKKEKEELMRKKKKLKK